MEIEALERLQLVSKVCGELENHFGMADKGVAEFVIELASQTQTFDKFKTALNEQGLGDQFDDPLIANLLRMILHMLPKKEKTKKGITQTSQKIVLISDAKEEIKARLPALAMPDEPEEKKDLMAEFEGLMPKWKDAKADEASRSESRDDSRRDRCDRKHEERLSRSKERGDSRRDRDRERDRDRDRDCDRDRRRDRNRDDRRGRDKDDDRRRRRSRSRSKGRDRERDLPDVCEVGMILDGRVNNLTTFGAFVKLEGLRQSQEGLVHISQIRNERINAVADALQRNQRVKVKVLKIEGPNLSLSMKEVDQNTGEDVTYKALAFECEARYTDYLRLKLLVRESREMKRSYLTLPQNVPGTAAVEDAGAADLSNQIYDHYDKITQAVEELDQFIVKGYGMISGAHASTRSQRYYQTVVGFLDKLAAASRSTLDAGDEAIKNPRVSC